MRKSFEYIIDNYLNALEQPFGGNEVANFIRRGTKYAVEREARIDTKKYLVQGSPGQGNWAFIPWVSVFDRKITTSATQGYYIVYLFCGDMSGFYLSLNQGWTYYVRNFGRKEGKEHIKKVATSLRNKLISSLDDFPETQIGLKNDGDLAIGYELGHICGKFYKADRIPDNIELVNDLRNLIGVYRELRGLVGNKTYGKLVSDILEKSHKSVLDNDGIDDEEYQEMVTNSEPTKTEEQPKDKPTPTTKNGSSIWPRDPKIAKEALTIANYKCEFDNSHETFISEKTGENFVEAHHLIPMKFQEHFTKSLDVPGNILSLCPNCHRKLHHARFQDRRDILNMLYDNRKEKLDKFGISIPLNKLIELYR